METQKSNSQHYKEAMEKFPSPAEIFR